jgi:hypothetical protein
MTTALEGGEGSASRPDRSLPSGKCRYPLYRRLGGPQGRSGQVRKISSPPGFDPRTAQPVASRYTDYATRPTLIIIIAATVYSLGTLFVSGIYVQIPCIKEIMTIITIIIIIINTIIIVIANYGNIKM